jgi:hypothetical protein
VAAFFYHKRVAGDPRYTDCVGEGSYSEIGLYTQDIPAFRKLFRGHGVTFEPIKDDIVLLQALCLPLGTSYNIEKHQNSKIQSKKRSQTESAEIIYTRFIYQ